MSLLEEKVMINITNANRTYYKEKGYDVPVCAIGVRKEIEINVVDLPPSSPVKILAVCDKCGRENMIRYQDYNRRNRQGLTYCNKCAKELFNSGENNNRWNSSLTEEERIIKRSKREYVDFCKRVLIRDNCTCFCCGEFVPNNHEVHHLDGYDWCIEKRYDIRNAVVLCKKCHMKFHECYGRGGNTKEQFEEWLEKKVIIPDLEIILPASRQVICLETKVIYGNVKETATKENVAASLICKCCSREKTFKYGSCTKSVHGKHYLYYDDYLEMTEVDIEQYMEWTKSTSFHSPNGRHSRARKVICLTTGEVFDAMVDASKHCRCNSGRLTECCQHKVPTCGKDESGRKLEWMYYDEYVAQNGA